MKNAVRNFVNEWTINILILLFGTTTLVQAFIVPTPSMDSTVKVGDHLLVDKLSYSPPGAVSRFFLPYTPVKRGDIIVFRYPLDISQNYVKRVMGIPGDHLRLHAWADPEGHTHKDVFLNGKQLNEPYIQHAFPGIDPYPDDFPSGPPNVNVKDRALEMLAHHVVNGELVVPENFYFAMGDNRDNSSDSRYWGFVPRENIIGKPLVIFWSYDANTEDLVDFTANHFIDLARNFFSKTRWDRELKLVRGYPVE
jgi:signal peptidase I